VKAWKRVLARLLGFRFRKPVEKPVRTPKARTVAAYRRSGGTDELRRIH